MQSTLTGQVSAQLVEANVPAERFRSICNHLLAHGCLMREEDKTEQALYDEARRVDGLIYEYFGLLGMTVHHDINLQTYRLFPPGARALGVTMVDESGEGSKSIKQRLSIDFVAAALALRCLYEERLQRGSISANGEALISFEDLSATMNGQIRRSLPATQSAKSELVNELRRHRLIHANTPFNVLDPDAVIAIRPYVMALVSNDALASVLAQEKAAPAAQAAQEVQEAQEVHSAQPA